MAVYLISGVSRGIGRVLAEQLAAAGHAIYGVARSPVPGLALAGRIELQLRDFAAYAEALAPALAELPQRDGQPLLDGLVHCAGVVRPGRLADQPAAEFSEQFDINVIAGAELVRHCLPSLRAARGTVVLVNSGSGLDARPPLSSYGAAKFALRGYAQALRQEEPRLRVSTVYPGRTHTDMQRTVRAAESGEYRAEEYLRPETVAGVIASVLTLPADAVITDVTLRPAGQPGPSSPDSA